MAIKTASARFDAFVIVAMIYIAVCNYNGSYGRMAQNAVILHTRRSVVADFYRIVIGIESKCRGVIEAISGFGYVFTYKSVLRQMTICTPRNSRMRTVLPCSILRIHNMTIDTGFGIA
jgi:hypothetical protein